ncbi:cupin domain-containing protein [Candidatus Bathyarchaeota archaeon]|nr:cupin domain-containing protein [Candidatus Bathyarchaeota archaeon]
MKIVHYSEVEKTEGGENSSKLTLRWLSRDCFGSDHFSIRYCEIEPNGNSPHHSHPWEHEIFVLEGKCLATGENTEKKCIAGNFIFIPADEKHQIKNNSKETLKILCVIPKLKRES